MSRTIVVSDDLSADLGEFAQGQHVTVEEVVDSAVRIYIANHQRWGGREYRPATQPFEIAPLVEKDEFGEPDVSVNQDKYLAEG
ncbi:MAG TPA: hypothetical protein VEX37_01785 [Thermomicrobiales bacterium]|nr:hypothetical protein [Thermomicrobiales bacterium]